MSNAVAKTTPCHRNVKLLRDDARSWADCERFRQRPSETVDDRCRRISCGRALRAEYPFLVRHHPPKSTPPRLPVRLASCCRPFHFRRLRQSRRSGVAGHVSAKRRTAFAPRSSLTGMPRVPSAPSTPDSRSRCRRHAGPKPRRRSARVRALADRRHRARVNRWQRSNIFLLTTEAHSSYTQRTNNVDRVEHVDAPTALGRPSSDRQSSDAVVI